MTSEISSAVGQIANLPHDEMAAEENDNIP
jgi:hypothetical protein